MSKRSKRLAVLEMKVFKTMNWYVLRYRKPVKANLNQWLRGEMFLNRRSVRRHYLDNNVAVSTVFLGVSFIDSVDGEPIIFETAIITGDKFETVGRCATWREALRLHRYALNYCKADNHG